jgi:valyl-tRNA synthetase
LSQDEDVLDTWFSSWLWPFSTMGWPRETEDLRRYYPTDVLVTGWEILFFWVARMIMAGLEFMGEIPFHTVYLNGMVRDEKRRKLSKSLGNSPDPLDLIERYGADGVRMGMMLITPEGKDVLFSEKRLETGRNFANKIWNASRFLLLSKDDFSYQGLPGEDEMEIEDRWILGGLNRIIQRATSGLESYDFNGVAKDLYQFFWHEFCDWYLEVIKPRVANKEKRDIALSVAFYTLDRLLKLLHPYMPFVTEEIWQMLPTKDGESIMISEWPQPIEIDDKEARRGFEFIKSLISEVREIRATFNVPRRQPVTVLLKSPEDDRYRFLLRGKLEILRFLADIGEVKETESPPPRSATAVVEGVTVFVPLEGIDYEKETNRLKKELDALTKQLEKVERRLRDTSFLEKAPTQVVKKEEEKRERFKEKVEKLRSRLESLKD